MSRRSIEESNEKLEQINNQVPESKLQRVQQVQNTMDGEVAPGETGGFQLKPSNTKGSKLKQEVVAKTIKDASYGGSNTGDGLNAAGRSVSGDAGGVLGAANMTPIADKSRSDSRYGKKLDRNSTKLNYIPNEQVLEEYSESKPLAEAADQDQGFNGTYRNEFARSQKKNGNVPAELMFSRSLDVIEKDVLYFPDGQYVRQRGVTLKDTPTRTRVLNNKGEYVNPSADNYDVPRGDYLNRALQVGLDAGGKIRFMTVDTRDITPEVSADDANKSSSAALRARNLDELQREVIDSKAGDEKADIWTPLARAVAQPTQTVGYLRDIESMTGNEIAAAYKKATTSFSFQLNRSHKDGQDLVNPAIDAFRGAYASKPSQTALANGSTDVSALLTPSEYAKASAAVMIAGYDSTAKYHNKADFILQPRGLRMHLQTADNNMDPFHLSKEFVQIYDNQEVFSTINREYDPLLPICMTDKCALVSRLSYADLFTFVKSKLKLEYESSAPYATTGSPSVLLIPKQFTAKSAGQYLHLYYKKSAIDPQTKPTINSSTGVIAINNNIEADISIWIDTIATVSDTSVEGLDVLLSDYAGKDISFSVATKYGKVTVAEDAVDIFPTKAGPFLYGFSDLRNNYVTRVTFPLLEGVYEYFKDGGRGVIAAVGKNPFLTNKVIGDIYRTSWSIPMVHSTHHFSLWSFIICAALPYITTSRINSMRDVLYYEKNVEYPFNNLLKVKDMTTRGYSNFQYTDYDHELEAKVMSPVASVKWVMPEFWTKVGDKASNSSSYVLSPWYMSENEFDVESGSLVQAGDQSSMTMPSIRSGARLDSLDMLYGMTEKDIRLAMDMIASINPLLSDPDAIDASAAENGFYKYDKMSDGIPFFNVKSVTVLQALALPRQVGYVMDAPYGLLTANIGDEALSDPANAQLAHGTSHRVLYWIAPGAVKFEPASGPKILTAAGVNVTRAANFKQEWFMIVANGKQAPFDHGMVASANTLYEDDGDAVSGANLFKPFIDADDGDVSGNAGLISFKSDMKAYWTRIQKLPFVLSPFDAISSNSTRTVACDPFELAFWFGLCGFRASDFRESVYNREKEVVNQGLLFTTDPWVEASPCFKEGAASSGVSIQTSF